MLVFIFILSYFLSLPGLSGQAGQEKAKEKIYIPKALKKVMSEGQKSGATRQDILFEMQKSLFLPAQDNYFVIFIFQMKNKDMALLSSTKNKEKNKEASISAENNRKAEFNLFLWFFKEEGGVSQSFKETYVPTQLEFDSDPAHLEDINTYTVCSILPCGKYRLSMAMTSLDLKRIGTYYYNFSLPEHSALGEKLAVTPVFFVKSIKELLEPEIPPVVHRDVFVYSAVEIQPKLESIFAPGETPDIFYYIYGCQADAANPQKFEIEITYNVKKGEEEVIKYSPKIFNFPIISHQIPLKKEKDEDLEPGVYELEISIKDNFSQRNFKETVQFEVRG